MSQESLCVTLKKDDEKSWLALTQLQITIKSSRERVEFLNRQMKDMRDVEQKAWGEMFQALQLDGSIPMSYNRDDWSMELINKGTQLLLSPFNPQMQMFKVEI